jgi:hypothetical protein
MEQKCRKCNATNGRMVGLSAASGPIEDDREAVAALPVALGDVAVVAVVAVASAAYTSRTNRAIPNKTPKPKAHFPTSLSSS